VYRLATIHSDTDKQSRRSAVRSAKNLYLSELCCSCCPRGCYIHLHLRYLHS